LRVFPKITAPAQKKKAAFTEKSGFFVIWLPKLVLQSVLLSQILQLREK
jgi:hypothetical protein